MGRKEDNIAKAKEIMHQPQFIRNIGTAAHIDHGKTTFSDNLIAGAGMMSEELAGKQLVLDFDEQEQARGITINAAAASMVHDFDGNPYLINLFDTPGHVDFGGDVTRAMRAIDGAIILVCAVEGIMPQTETVIRQALREKVKPVLFINKVDRLINEVKLPPEEMQGRFAKIIAEVNRLIQKFAPEELKGKWQVRPDDGTVAFGSAYHNWAVSVPYMQRTKLNMAHVYKRLEAGETRELAKECPLAQVVLNMVVRHLPSPDVSQAYRIPHIWKGDVESDVGKSMVTCNENGPLAMVVTKIVVDPHAGEVAIGRVFSGKVKRGQEVFLAGYGLKNRIQNVGVMVGADRVTVEEVDAGNLAACVGLKDAIAGTTVTSIEEFEPFERIVHVSEPVVTVSVEAKHVRDLPKLVEVLRSISKADPSIQVQINPETGENLMSGMGELHLEITEYRIRNEHGVEIVTSPPIVVYREGITKESPRSFEGKSPNKHNRFYIEVEPLDEKTIDLLREGRLHEGKVRKQDEKEVSETLQSIGWERDEARKVAAIDGTNMLVDATKGVQNLFETMELVIDGFKEVMRSGPRANEPVTGLKVRLLDAKLHEDAVHRGPAQTIPAVRNAIYGAMTEAGVSLMEPRQKIFINVPQDLMGDVTRELQQRRSVIEDIEAEGEAAIIHGVAPVAEMFGFAASIRSATGGRALWSTESAGFAPVPHELLEGVTREVRKRKGLKEEAPTAAYYAE